MATINPTINNDVSSLGGSKVVAWVLPTTGDTGAPIRLDRFSISSFSVFGTTVTSLALQGSNDADAPTNWNPMKDGAGTSLGALNAAGFYTPRDLPIWVRPVLTSGAAVTVQMALHRGDMAAND
jgi:hypothetical protein